MLHAYHPRLGNHTSMNRADASHGSNFWTTSAATSCKNQKPFTGYVYVLEFVYVYMCICIYVYVYICTLAWVSCTWFSVLGSSSMGHKVFAISSEWRKGDARCVLHCEKFDEKQLQLHCISCFNLGCSLVDQYITNEKHDIFQHIHGVFVSCEGVCGQYWGEHFPNPVVQLRTKLHLLYLWLQCSYQSFYQSSSLFTESNINNGCQKEAKERGFTCTSPFWSSLF